MEISRTEECLEYVRRALTEEADPRKALQMAAYMKTTTPFYGVPKPQRVPILRHMKREFPPRDRAEYEDIVLALWAEPQREAKYLAQGVAYVFTTFVVPDSWPIYDRFVVEGAWWDFVDEAATHPIRHLVLDYPDAAWNVLENWNHDEHMWRRRASIICQVGAKERTDAERLFRFCAARAHETEFFIRKAIGWALRDYSRTDPEAVARFVSEQRHALSGLSAREAARHIGHLVTG